MGFLVVDWLITYVEGIVMLSAVLQICGPKYKGKKHIYLILLFAGINMVGTAILNSISAFSFFTPVLAVAFLFLDTLFLTNGSNLLRIAASIMVPFIVLSIGYALMIILCLIRGGDFLVAFDYFMTPGVPRFLLLFSDKFADIIIYCLCRNYLGEIAKLGKRWLCALFAFSCLFYGLTQYFFGAILSGEYSRLHRASILSFLVLVLFFIVISMLLLSISAREKQSLQHHILEKTNQMMEQNYKLLHSDLQENAKRMHDFHHHLKVISSLAEQENDNSVIKYVSSLMEVSFREAKMCRSGCDIIDAVINCSVTEAEKHNISFTYELYLSSSLTILAVDLCAVLGNQLENALEACCKITDTSQRKIRVILTQKDDFFISKVVNSVDENPFTTDGNLVTQKADKLLHGLGIKSICSVIEKYNGHMHNSCSDHTFISEVLMCMKQFDT